MQFNLDESTTADDATELWPVYLDIFGDHADMRTWRESTWDRHVVRDGFRVARAYADGRLVGFAYGYTGERGQWWTDRAIEVLGPATAEAWLGGHFELVSIGVRPGWRRSGIGRALLVRLMDGLPHERRVLMTAADADDPARRLYAAEGWRVIGKGLTAEQVIMAQGTPRGERAMHRFESGRRLDISASPDPRR